MRTEQEMYDLILKVAKEDERIRAVYIDGSRTNPNAPRDIFQDYDVGYVVRETESFIKDRGLDGAHVWKNPVYAAPGRICGVFSG